VSEKVFLSQLKDHQHIIYKLVHLYANSAEDKKDIYQEIVLQAWKTYPSFRGDARFSTWLYRLSLNTIFTIKRNKGKVYYTDTASFEEGLSSTTDWDDKERLYQAIRTLPETERAIISLHLDGYDNQEISEMLGITPNLAAVKLHRSKKHLSTLLKNI
jgi:RNA polymerase sigma-70 factor (ECF subfamily)